MTRVEGDWLTDPAAQSLLKVLEQGGHAAYFVGGCVRNALLGEPVRDVDIATDATPDEVTDLVEAAGFRAVPTGADHGTITVVADGKGFEVTTFRRDVETFGRTARVSFSRSLPDDAARRDFTINALYSDRHGNVVDPLGGLADLTARRVRFIDDAGARIREDYLRILRFFRFYAWYGDPAEGPDPEALAAIPPALQGLAHVSRERIGAEMIKMLAARDPAPALAAMAMTGTLAAVLPGADATPVAPLVALEVGAGIAPDPVRRLAAICPHDPSGPLRLSRAQARRWQTLRAALASEDGAEAMGYRLGAEDAISAILLRAALTATMPEPGFAELARRGAGHVFPLRGEDLAARFSGPDLGRELRRREERWIASGFRLGRRDLLT